MSHSNYQPTKAVWEITYACNMRCKHCGSSCGDPLPNELTYEKSLSLCDELAEIGIQHITLSGGEPLVRSDWSLLAARLSKNGIRTNIISNGWLITEEIIEKAFKSGITNVCLSLDGYGETHDFIRRIGSFDRVIESFSLLTKQNMPSACVTSVNHKNLPELPKIKQELLRLKVRRWQIQLAMPMGNLASHPELVIKPSEVNLLMDFCYETMLENQIMIHIGDNLGYNTDQYEQVLSQTNRSDSKSETRCHWQGCPAGKHVIGIRADGAVCGCLAIRGEKFFEGNVNDATLKEIWHKPKAFCWNRTLKKEDLTGFCSKCLHGDTCLGGCTAHKLSFGNSLYAENPNCLYRLEFEKVMAELAKTPDQVTLINKLKQLVACNEYQIAELYLEKALKNEPNNVYLIDLAGFVHYFLKNYALSLKFNEQALAINPKHPYALRGKGLCLYKFGKIEEAIGFLQAAIELADNHEVMDAYFDLTIVFLELNKISDAMRILELGRAKSQSFTQESQKLYESCQQLLAQAK